MLSAKSARRECPCGLPGSAASKIDGLLHVFLGASQFSYLSTLFSINQELEVLPRCQDKSKRELHSYDMDTSRLGCIHQIHPNLDVPTMKYFSSCFFVNFTVGDVLESF